MNLKNLAVYGTMALTLLGATACNRQERQVAQQKAGNAVEKTVDKVQDAFDDVAVPTSNEREDPAAREQQRFDQQWRDLQSFRAQQAAQQAQQQTAQQQAAQQAQQANLKFVTGVKESFGKTIDVNAINAAPVAVPIEGDLSGPSVLRAQVYLDRANFSIGAIDGRWGRNSAIAVWWYQRANGINATGSLDEPTFRSLAQKAGAVEPITRYTVTGDDMKGPFVDVPTEMYDKAKLDCLCYESLQEKLAERFHVEQEFLQKLNPDVKFGSLAEGAVINVPNVRPPVTQDRPDIARVVVSIAGNTFNAFDAQGNLVFHAPTTLGSKYDPSPQETVTVKKVVHDPHFHYQPKLFHEVPDHEPEANLNPGPNSPVGVVWIALSKRHFGIHGTSDPESIGYAASHGCVRLTNWDAREVGHRISPNVQVEFVDTRKRQERQSAE